MKHYLDVIKEEVNLDRVQLSLKNLVFGIYKRNGIVITFSVSDRKHDTLIPLIKQYTKNLLWEKFWEGMFVKVISCKLMTATAPMFCSLFIF